MNLRSFYRVSAIVLVAQLALAAYGLWLVGPDQQVPVHWGVEGQADGWATALVAFAIMPLVTAGIVALFAAVPRIEPRRRNLERSASAYRTTATAVVLFLGAAQVVVVFASLGDSLPRLFVLAGISLIALTPFGNAELVVWVMVAWIVALLVVSLAYSYRVWKTDPDRRPRAGEDRKPEELGSERVR